MDAITTIPYQVNQLCEEMSKEMATCRRTSSSTGASTSSVTPRVEYPKLKFTGKRDGKEVKNFLW